MMPIDFRSLSVCCLVGWIFVAGCNSEQLDPETVALRDSWLVTEEPPSAMSLTQLMEQLSGSGSDQVVETADNAPPDEAVASEDTSPQPASEVTVVGRVFAGDFEPWEAGKASFLISELPERGHGEGHDADNCPFCKRRAAQAPKAVIEFRDSRGELVEIDSRSLFGLEKQDVVVVRGTARVGELNTLVVTANRLFVRR